MKRFWWIALIVLAGCEKGHWEKTGRKIPAHTTLMPIQTGKTWTLIPIFHPETDEKRWVKEPDTRKAEKD